MRTSPASLDSAVLLDVEGHQYDDVSCHHWDALAIAALAAFAERHAHLITPTCKLGLFAAYSDLVEPAKRTFQPTGHANATTMANWAPNLLEAIRRKWGIREPTYVQWIRFLKSGYAEVAPFVQVSTQISAGGATVKHAVVLIPRWTSFTADRA